MLTDADFQRAARMLNAPENHIRAVVDVESGPYGGIDGAGLPRILFEGHIFSRLTGGVYDRTNPSISYRNWTTGFYCRGTPDARNRCEHERLEQAALLARGAALMSASWGLFQIMGENYALCGYATLQDFVNAMYSGESAQLDAFMEFVSHNRAMSHALRTGDWKVFARMYNGPAYAKNKYDTRLAAAAAAEQKKVA